MWCIEMDLQRHLKNVNVGEKMCNLGHLASRRNFDDE